MTTNPSSDTTEAPETDTTETKTDAAKTETDAAETDPMPATRALNDGPDEGRDGGPNDELDVPDGAAVHRCGHCERPFAREDFLALHRAREHYRRLDEDELAAYEEAYEEETAGLRHFKIFALGVMVLIYFGFLLTYLLVDLLAA